MKRKNVFTLIIVFLLLIPVTGLTEEIKVEGTVQGLLCALSGNVCKPGQENIMRAIEDKYVLMTDDGKWYLVPTFPSTQVSPFLGMRARVEGTLVLNGKGIEASKAEVFENGKWVVKFSPEILEEIKRNQKLLNAPIGQRLN